MPKNFYVCEPICPEEQYYVPRDDVINSIVQKLLSPNNSVLLQNHRQAGKSSLLLPITKLLKEKGQVVLCISLRGIGSHDFWISLSQRINAVHGVGGSEFHDAAGFLNFFGWNNFKKDVCLILDDIHHLLSSPNVCESFLSALRVTKTARDTNLEKTYALAGILGIGLLLVKKLILSDSKASPFIESDLFRLPQPSEGAVRQMFTSFGNDVDLDLAIFGRDIYGRTGGHMGLTSLLGNYLQEWIMGNLQRKSKSRITIGEWVAHMCGSGFAGYLSESNCNMTIMPSLRSHTPISLSARIFLRDLLHGTGSVADPSLGSESLRDVVDYLEIVDIVVRIESDSSTGVRTTEVRLAAPLLCVILLSYFNEFDPVRVPRWLQLQTKDGFSNQLELLSCIRQSLPFMDRNRIYQDSSLNSNGRPVDFSYHFDSIVCCSLWHLHLVGA